MNGEALGYGRAMSRTQTMVQLSDDLVKALSEEAAHRGCRGPR